MRITALRRLAFEDGFCLGHGAKLRQRDVPRITGGSHDVTKAILDAVALAGEEMTFGGACPPRPR
jgi:hypothetical protein